METAARPTSAERDRALGSRARRPQPRRPPRSRSNWPRARNGSRNLRARLRQFEESQRGTPAGHRRKPRAAGRVPAARATQSRWNILAGRDRRSPNSISARKRFAARDRRADPPARGAPGTSASQLTRRGPADSRPRSASSRRRSTPRSWPPAKSATNATRLADRLREDYGIELAELEHEPTDEEQHQREEVQQEIDELRQKINNLGNVNLEALAELDQLETRLQDALRASTRICPTPRTSLREDHRARSTPTAGGCSPRRWRRSAGIFSSCSATCSAAARPTSSWRKTSTSSKAASRSSPGRPARSRGASRC